MERRSFFKVAAATVAGTAALAAGNVSAADKQFTIALVPGLTTDAFYITMRKGAEAAAKAVGAELVFQGAPDFNPVTQVPVLDAVIAKHPDAILIAPASADANVQTAVTSQRQNAASSNLYGLDLDIVYALPFGLEAEAHALLLDARYGKRTLVTDGRLSYDLPTYQVDIDGNVTLPGSMMSWPLTSTFP